MRCARPYESFVRLFVCLLFLKNFSLLFIFVLDFAFDAYGRMKEDGCEEVSIDVLLLLLNVVVSYVFLKLFFLLMSFLSFHSRFGFCLVAFHSHSHSHPLIRILFRSLAGSLQEAPVTREDQRRLQWTEATGGR
jgi:hypothetical protein